MLLSESFAETQLRLPYLPESCLFQDWPQKTESQSCRSKRKHAVSRLLSVFWKLPSKLQTYAVETAAGAVLVIAASIHLYERSTVEAPTRAPIGAVQSVSMLPTSLFCIRCRNGARSPWFPEHVRGSLMENEVCCSHLGSFEITGGSGALVGSLHCRQPRCARSSLGITSGYEQPGKRGREA